MFNAKITSNADEEALIYLRYLTARKIYLDSNQGLSFVSKTDYETRDKLWKHLREYENAALKELLK